MWDVGADDAMLSTPKPFPRNPVVRSSLACELPGCPNIEEDATVLVVWTDATGRTYNQRRCVDHHNRHDNYTPVLEATCE